jgi:hypothetical protein
LKTTALVAFRIRKSAADECVVLSGIFVFEKSGILAGLEVYGPAAEAPKTLPLPEALRLFADEANKDCHGA